MPNDAIVSVEEISNPMHVWLLILSYRRFKEIEAFKKNGYFNDSRRLILKKHDVN
jgi:hypothetical protein